jgi:cullin 1
VDFNVLVLATGSWPLQPPSTNFTIPKDLVACEQLFVKFYQQQHSGRKLNWLHQLSKGELRARYGKKYSFVTSTYQMGILLQFNSNESMTTDDLQIATQLTQSTLVNTLAVPSSFLSSFGLSCVRRVSCRVVCGVCDNNDGDVLRPRG